MILWFEVDERRLLELVGMNSREGSALLRGD
jgi:hypothetical protein